MQGPSQQRRRVPPLAAAPGSSRLPGRTLTKRRGLRAGVVQGDDAAGEVAPGDLGPAGVLDQPGQAGLVVKGRVGGIQRGYALVGGSFQSDRAAETLSPAALLALSGPGSELTYTLVPAGTERRIGIDRDRDGHLDRDELDAGADPADPASFPGLCVADLAPAGGDGRVDGADLAFVLAQWGASGGAADLNHDGVVNGGDLGVLLGLWGPCN